MVPTPVFSKLGCRRTVENVPLQLPSTILRVAVSGPQVAEQAATADAQWGPLYSQHPVVVQARAEGIQVVKVVHGKGHINGQALLKTAVNGWLRQMPEVLAFSSADARNGGTGAVMVLLKRPRGDRSEP